MLAASSVLAASMLAGAQDDVVRGPANVRDAVRVVSGAAAEIGEPLLNPLPEPSRSSLSLVLEPFVTLPKSVPTSGVVTDRRPVRYNRINHLSALPDGSGRLAVPDMNGPLYTI